MNKSSDAFEFTVNAISNKAAFVKVFFVDRAPSVTYLAVCAGLYLMTDFGIITILMAGIASVLFVLAYQCKFFQWVLGLRKSLHLIVFAEETLPGGKIKYVPVFVVKSKGAGFEGLSESEMNTIIFLMGQRGGGYRHRVGKIHLRPSIHMLGGTMPYLY